MKRLGILGILVCCAIAAHDAAAALVRIDPPTLCTDGDEDGYSVEGGDCGEIDCDDTDETVFPCATENPGDGIDQDCSGEDRADVEGAYHEIEPNDDALGYSNATYVGGYSIGTAHETYGRVCSPSDFDGFVYDLVDFGNFVYRITWPETGESAQACVILGAGAWHFDMAGDVGDYILDFSLGEAFDEDADGYYARETCGTDCDDANPLINGCAEEVRGNGIDENCTGFDFPVEPVVEVEPNDDWQAPQDLTITSGVVTSLAGAFDVTGDVEFFHFSLDRSGTIDITLAFDCLYDYDLYLFIYDEHGTTIAGSWYEVPEVLEDIHLDVVEYGTEFGILLDNWSGDQDDYELEIFFEVCDGDGDGYENADCDGDDCDDTDPEVNPGHEEVGGNGIDDNCNGQIDECFIGVVM